VAHRRAAELLAASGDFERVIVVPVHEHALEKRLAPYDHRIAMCEASMLVAPSVEVSCIESELEPPNFTLHTLRALRQRLPGAEFRLVVGADVLLEADRWHEFDEVIRLAPLYPLGRAGVDCEEAPVPVLPEVSSSEIRERLRGRHEGPIASGLRARLESWLWPAVIDYIEAHDLYR
jgi:nicotinate-nucleotide adenylyltransferase